MNLVWHSTLKGTTKRFALLALADRASDEGECSALGVPNLCRKTGIPRSTMFELLRDLEQVDNLIQREEQTRANGSRRASRFWINLPLLETMQQSGDDDRDEDSKANPFKVSAAQPPVREPDGTPGEVIHSPGEVVHTPVRSPDGPRPAGGPPSVRELDGGSPVAGPLDPFSCSEKDPDPESGRIGSATENDHHAALAARIVDGLSLRCEPTSRQVGQITAAIAGALRRGVLPPVVAEHARQKAREADTVKYLLRAFSEAYLPASIEPTQAAKPGLPPLCGQCEANPAIGAYPADPVSARIVWLDAKRTRSQLCPRCHPRAIKQAAGGAQ